jgi:hypothetical protein
MATPRFLLMRLLGEIDLATELRRHRLKGADMTGCDEQVRMRRYDRGGFYVGRDGSDRWNIIAVGSPGRIERRSQKRAAPCVMGEAGTVCF